MSLARLPGRRATALLFLAACLIALVARAPAPLIGGALPPQIDAGGWRGTIWDGSVRLYLAGPAVGMDVQWQVRPLSVLAGCAHADIVASAPGLRATGQVERCMMGGGLKAHDLSVTVRMGGRAPRVALAPMVATGTVEANIASLSWSDERLRASGNGRWSRATLLAPVPLELGDLTGSLTSDPQGVTLAWTNTNGPAGLSGRLSLDDAGNYRLSLEVEPGEDLAWEDIASGLANAGPVGIHRLERTGPWSELRMLMGLL